jgi:hypothetical protein
LKNDQTHDESHNKMGFFSFFGEVLIFFYEPTKAHKQWNNSFETQQGITLAHMQKLSKVNDRI